jgi:hypothetical protein
MISEGVKFFHRAATTNAVQDGSDALAVRLPRFAVHLDIKTLIIKLTRNGNPVLCILLSLPPSLGSKKAV